MDSKSLIAPVALVVSLALNVVLIVLLIVCNIKAHNEATREAGLAALENSHGGCGGIDVIIKCNPVDGKFQVTCPSDGSDVTPIYQAVVDKANSCRAAPS
jgi:hypothetical protein